MWIIPRNHPMYQQGLVCVQDMVDSTEELSLLSEELTSSLMWRSSPSLLRTWLTRWKKVKWFRHLSGRMLKHSHQKSFEEKLTIFLQDIPVNPSLLQEKEKEKKTQDTYGLTSAGQLTLFSPTSAFLKTWRDTSPWGLGKSLPIWLASDTEWSMTEEKLRSDYSLRRNAMLRTKGSESLSWPTVTQDSADSRQKKYNQGGTGLQVAVGQWLTPTGVDIERTPEGMQSRKEYRESIGRKYVEGCLTEQVKNWPSITAATGGPCRVDTDNPRGMHSGNPLATAVQMEEKSWPTPRESEHKGCGPVGSKSQKHMFDRSYLCAVVAEENAKGVSDIGQPDQDLHNSNGKNQELSENWATPNAGDGRAGMSTGRKQKSLGQDVTLAESKNWPTPDATNTNDGVPWVISKQQMDERRARVKEAVDAGITKQGSGRSANLAMSVQRELSWPTARTSDAEGGRIETELTDGGFRSRRKTSDQNFGAKLRDAIEHDKPVSLKLNADWVEQLMGLPSGWTQLSSKFNHDTFDGVVECMQNRTDRLRLLGNGVVPITATKAFYTLIKKVLDNR